MAVIFLGVAGSVLAVFRFLRGVDVLKDRNLSFLLGSENDSYPCFGACSIKLLICGLATLKLTSELERSILS